MKLIIQIPCFNEEKTLPEVVRDLPTRIDGIAVIERQIIDDGSSDRTVEVAKGLGIEHIVSFSVNRGLAAAFAAGMTHAVKQGADILVNTDGDNQYCGEDIKKLVAPIVQGKAEMVIGCRPIVEHPEFSALKKLLQLLGSWVLRNLSKTQVRDAASGFRAYSREAMLRLNVYSSFSYTMETLIQAGHSNMTVASVDIRVNPKKRDSRLFKNIFHYIFKSGATMVGIYVLYRAKTLFYSLAVLSFAGAVAITARYLILTSYFEAPGKNFWPSIIIAGALLVGSIQFYLTALLASLIAANRRLSEEVLYRLRKRDTV